ncbi:hypothetical protein EDD86DRAFT_124193 [Gorgonomyces haynaldii]|nr:hypothetical protein EDD86DRAFT_124193 [Gorgonomyces haynaldii]
MSSCFALFAASILAANTVSTFAGSGISGNDDGTGTLAKLGDPYRIVFNRSDYMFVASYGGATVRVISPSGLVTTLAGNGTAGTLDGPVNTALFNKPAGVCIDTNGNLFIVDYQNSNVRKITSNGIVSTFAGSLDGLSGQSDGIGSNANFTTPQDCAFDSQGNMFVTDYGNNLIRKISSSGTVTTFAGNSTVSFADGIGLAASFNSPSGIAIDRSDVMYIVDKANNRIRRVTADGNVTTFAGTGSAGGLDGDRLSATFNYPTSITIAPNGNLFIGDSGNRKVRVIYTNGTVGTVAGTGGLGYQDGDGAVAKFKLPMGVAFNSQGELFVSDANDRRIRKIVLDESVLTTSTATTALPTTVSMTTATTPVTTTVSTTAATAALVTTASTTVTISTSITTTIIVTTSLQTTTASQSATTGTAQPTTTRSTTAASATATASFASLPLDAPPPQADNSSTLWWMTLPLGVGIVGSGAFLYYRRINKKPALPH